MKKKICLIIPSLQAGGMERVMSELATYFFSKPEIEIHLIMYGKNPEVFYKLPSDIKIHQPNFKFDNKLRIWYTIKIFFFLRSEVKQIQPFSILSFGEYWNNFSLLALLGLEFPVYVSDRCQPDKSLGKIHTALRGVLYPRAKGVIVQTKKAEEIYNNLVPGAKLYVIGNPIKEISKTGIEIRENIVLSVGRLINSKHHDELIKLFLNIALPGWKLVIVGGDAIKQRNLEKLRNLVRELNAEDRIELAGSQTDVDAYYNKSKIFAFTSSSEGFPNVIGEAMSAGLPVVAFDCIAGPSELIENEVTGYLVPVYDYSKFEERLKSLMNDEKLCQAQGINGKKKISRFSVEIIGEQYYNTLLS